MLEYIYGYVATYEDCDRIMSELRSELLTRFDDPAYLVDILKYIAGHLWDDFLGCGHHKVCVD